MWPSDASNERWARKPYGNAFKLTTRYQRSVHCTEGGAIIVKIPFGKYRGQSISELPEDYLAWLKTIELYPQMRAAVEFELYCRRAEQKSQQTTTASVPSGPTIRLKPDQIQLARLVFELGYRAAAFRQHPDRGGDVGAMQDLNAFAESVRGQLTALEGGR